MQYWKPHWDLRENKINGPKYFPVGLSRCSDPTHLARPDDELHPAGVVHIRNIIFTRVGHFLFRYQLNKILDSSNTTNGFSPQKNTTFILLQIMIAFDSWAYFDTTQRCPEFTKEQIISLMTMTPRGLRFIIIGNIFGITI